MPPGLPYYALDAKLSRLQVGAAGWGWGWRWGAGGNAQQGLHCCKGRLFRGPLLRRLEPCGSVRTRAQLHGGLGCAVLWHAVLWRAQRRRVVTNEVDAPAWGCCSGPCCYLRLGRQLCWALKTLTLKSRCRRLVSTAGGSKGRSRAPGGGAWTLHPSANVLLNPPQCHANRASVCS